MSSPFDLAGDSAELRAATENGQSQSEETGRGDELRAANLPERQTLAILPLRSLVVFPGMVVPLTIGRPAALKLVEQELPGQKFLGLVTQKDEANERPGPSDLYSVGVIAQVLKLIRQADGSAVLIIQARQRIRLGDFVQTEPYLRANTDLIQTAMPPDPSLQAAFNNLRAAASKLLELSPEIPEQARAVLSNIEEPEMLGDLLAGNLGIDTDQKQAILEETDFLQRARLVQEALQRQIEIAELQQKLRKDVEGRFSEGQRRAYLREQLRAIQRELGEEEPGDEEQVEQLRNRLKEAGAPPVVMDVAEKELKRLSHIPSASPETSVIVSYVEMLADLPWTKRTEDHADLAEAERILNRDHFGLERVKRRILEYLAVRKLNPEGRSPIMCFLGPPGVGKTSLGQSIADALGRKFSRISLGGLRDEAEIRGHRRTYIGVPFDLSQVIFIGTANYVEGIPAPLQDRMEMISIPGYTETEKLRIAQNYLVPRQIQEHGLNPENCHFEEEALRVIIQEYTYEAGVRDLERRIAAVCRAIAAEVAKGVSASVTVNPSFVRGILGGSQRSLREERLPGDLVGVVTGLAYTPNGGDILFVEATRFPGKGNLQLTGHVGEVMRESMVAAYSLVRSRAEKLGVNSSDFAENDVHIHVPSGAVPKDGPSAGVAITTALASLFSGRPVRNDVAMTGEITLRGAVLPIGGLKEKSLAAVRAGITQIIIPKANEKDLEDLPGEVKQVATFHPVGNIDEVLWIALRP
jgi:ATP-dependent Lon protease